MEFCQSIYVVAQLVVAQAEQGIFCVSSVEAIRVGQFMKMNPPTFTRVKMEKDLRLS